MSDFHDRPTGEVGLETPERYFDRFVFNMHPVDALLPSLVFGLGLHPRLGVAEGFLVATLDGEQRNLRFCDALADARRSGPFSYDVVEPMRRWRLRLDENPSGVCFDLLWTARAPAWTGHVEVGDATSFDHLFQSGRYAGELVIDETSYDVQGWWGQRDRSRGLRTMSGGQGLHLWVQAQLPDRSVGFLSVEDRSQRRLLLEGAVMHEDGDLDPVVDLRHDLVFDDGLDLREGRLSVRTAGGSTYLLECDASGRGGYLAGGGYGGHHGRAEGADLQHDVYPLDGSVSPRTVDSALVDRLTAFTWEGTSGSGILEFAHSRSQAYTYRPTLGQAPR